MGNANNTIGVIGGIIGIAGVAFGLGSWVESKNKEDKTEAVAANLASRPEFKEQIAYIAGQEIKRAIDREKERLNDISAEIDSLDKLITVDISDPESPTISFDGHLRARTGTFITAFGSEGPAGLWVKSYDDGKAATVSIGSGKRENDLASKNPFEDSATTLKIDTRSGKVTAGQISMTTGRFSESFGSEGGMGIWAERVSNGEGDEFIWSVGHGGAKKPISEGRWDVSKTLITVP